MDTENIPKEIMGYLQSITNKRAKIVIEHILKHGYITTEEIQEYGYDHPPRAARDVREFGVPLITFRVKNKSETRKIAAYKFGDLSKINKLKTGGRSSFPKEFIAGLYEFQKGKCSICNIEFEDRYLQIDHKIPYEVIGSRFDVELHELDFQLLCGSCNRAKSWSCEHCINWIEEKAPEICLNCYWGDPITYTHIALKEIRRADIVWIGSEIQVYEKLKRDVQERKINLPDFVKEIIQKHIQEDHN